jgi:hypothetical protein
MKPRHSMAGLLGAILLLSAPVTWLTSLDEPGFVITKILCGLVALGYWGRAILVHRRGMISGRGGVHLWVSAQWLGAVLIAGAALVAFLQQRSIAWDLTSEHVYTVAPETADLLRKLEQPLRIEAYYDQRQGHARVIKKLVEQLRGISPSIELEVIDPSRNPKRATAALISADSPKIIIRMGDKEERLRLPTEQQLAQGLSRLLGKQRTVFVLRGHGEWELSGEDQNGFARFARELSSEGLQLAYLDLAKEGRVPSQAAALLWLGPKTPLLAQELEIMRLYLATGGRLLVASQAGTGAAANPLLDGLGLRLGEGVVVDPQVSGAPEVQGQAAAMVAAYTDHAVVARLAASGLRTLLRRAAPIELTGKLTQGSVQPLAAAAAESWVEEDHQSRVWQRGSGAKGNAILAALWRADCSKIEVRRSDEARLGLLSDVQMMSNGGLVHGGNRVLVLNLVSWLADSDDQFEISARERRVSRLFLTLRERSRLRLLALDALPLLFLLPGLIIWQRRRREV